MKLAFCQFVNELATYSLEAPQWTILCSSLLLHDLYRNGDSAVCRTMPFLQMIRSLEKFNLLSY